MLCIVRSIPKGKEPKPTQKSNAPLLLIEQKASSSDKQDVSDTPFCVCREEGWVGLVAGALNHLSWKLFTNDPSELSVPVWPLVIKNLFCNRASYKLPFRS